MTELQAIGGSWEQVKHTTMVKSAQADGGHVCQKKDTISLTNALIKDSTATEVAD